MKTATPRLTGRYAILDGTVTVIGPRTRPLADVHYQTAIGPVHASVIHTTYATREEAERSLAARALRAIPSEARTATSRANGAKGGRPLTLKADISSVEWFAGKATSDGVLAAGTKVRHLTCDETADGTVWHFEALGDAGWVRQRTYSEPQV